MNVCQKHNYSYERYHITLEADPLVLIWFYSVRENVHGNPFRRQTNTNTLLQFMFRFHNEEWHYAYENTTFIQALILRQENNSQLNTINELPRRNFVWQTHNFSVQEKHWNKTANHSVTTWVLIFEHRDLSIRLNSIERSRRSIPTVSKSGLGH